jgi:hypothetical protein
MLGGFVMSVELHKQLALTNLSDRSVLASILLSALFELGQLECPI